MNLSILPDLGVTGVWRVRFRTPVWIKANLAEIQIRRTAKGNVLGKRLESAVKSSILAIPAIVAIGLCGPLPVLVQPVHPPLPPYVHPFPPKVTQDTQGSAEGREVNLTPSHPISDSENRQQPVPDHPHGACGEKRIRYFTICSPLCKEENAQHFY
jgi:hypothetical protein